MLPTIKAEFRKLLTVRSTYIITALAVALVVFIAFYLQGWRLDPGSLRDSNQLANDAFGALNLTIFGAIVAILLVTHEYRYNTILHTLTSSPSRKRILLAKFLAVSAYAVILTVLIGVLSPLMSYLGVYAHGHTLVPQTLHLGELIWRGLFYGWAYGMFGLLFALLLRNQVGSIVALFLIPNMAEQLIGYLLLKSNSVYMPFTALGQVVKSFTPSDATAVSASSPLGSLSPAQAALVVCVYLVIGWIVATVLFLRRDAN